MSLKVALENAFGKYFWQIFPKLPFCRVMSADNYIVENKYQFIVVKIKYGSKIRYKAYRTGRVNYSTSFLNYLQSLGAEITTHFFVSRKDFELVAKRIPVLKRYTFSANWSKLYEKT